MARKTVLFLLIITSTFLLSTIIYRHAFHHTNVLSLTDSTFPHEDITIPYLTNRIYDTNLTDLKRHLSYPNYNSYITSYDSDGNTIYSLYTIPKGTPPGGGWPAIILVHGYIPPAKYSTKNSYFAYVNALANKGFVVIKPDLRGNGTSGGDPGGSYYGSDYVIDIQNAFSSLEKQPYINPDRISLWGHSMGGNLVFRSLVVNPKIHKVIIWAGAGYTYQDLVDYRITDSSFRPLPPDSPSQIKRRQIIETYGEFNSESDFWKLVVPTNFLASISGNIQVHHARNDNVVLIDYSRNLQKILKAYPNIKNSFYEYNTGGHNLTGNSFTSAISRTINFLNSDNTKINK